MVQMMNKLKVFILLFFLCNFCYAQKIYVQKYIEHRDTTCRFFYNNKKYTIREHSSRLNYKCKECNSGRLKCNSGRLKRLNQDENFLVKSGKYQRKSAVFASCALGSALIGGSLVAIELKENPNQPVIATSLGGIFGSACLAFTCVAIHYQYKSGRELEINGTSLKYRF